MWSTIFIVLTMFILILLIMSLARRIDFSIFKKHDQRLTLKKSNN